MSSYTRVGQNIWIWQPFIALPNDARMLWLMLYTSAPAKRVPGLWTGTITTMASIAKMGYADTANALTELLTRDMVEYDPHHEVLRFCQLPDAGEYPTAPSHLMTWWNRFHEIVPCAVRDRHVPTLRWIVEQGARESTKNRSKKVSQKHEQMWEETFGSITLADHSVDAVKVVSSDTSTPSQPGLFAPKAPVSVSISEDPEWSNSKESGPRALGQEKEKENSSLDPPGSGSVSGSGDPESTPSANVIPFPRSPDALRALVTGFPARVNAARDRVASALGIPEHRPVAIQGGEQTLLERLRESTDPPGDLDHALRVAEAEAQYKHKGLRWLGWSIAEPKAWRSLLAASVHEIARAGPNAPRSAFDIAAEVFGEMGEPVPT